MASAQRSALSIVLLSGSPQHKDCGIHQSLPLPFWFVIKSDVASPHAGTTGASASIVGPGPCNALGGRLDNCPLKYYVPLTSMFRHFCFCSRVKSAEPWPEPPDRRWLSKVETQSKAYAPRLRLYRSSASWMLDDDDGNEGVRGLKELVYASFRG